MLSTRTKAWLCYGVSSLLLLCAGYSGLWLVSSASLACAACNCEYSLFAEQVRCRQPLVAGFLACALLGSSAALAVLGYRIARNRRTGDA